MNKQEWTIFLDLDGVLVDFMSAAMKRHGREFSNETYPAGVWNIFDHLGISEEDFWRPLVGFDFWDELQPYPWAAELYFQLKQLGEVVIATSPCRDPQSAAGKVSWMQRNLKQNFRSFFIGPQKHHLSKPGSILIDDNERTVERFRAAGRGYSILFPMVWNSGGAVFDPAGNVLQKVRNFIEGIELL